MGRKANRASQLFQSGPKWKREFVHDHKFDYIDLTEFRTRNCWIYLRYLFMYITIIVSFAAYCADIWTACILLIYNQWSLSSPPKIPLYISKWIYVACIALSFILLAWDIRKARIVMASRDISYAATNNMVSKYMSVKSYNCFSLFMKIQSSRKFSDTTAFYVFFTLKGWKRLLFAQGPRQIIAGITVYAILKTAWTNEATGAFQFDDNMDKYGKDWQQVIALCLMSFTCLYWILSVLNLLCAIFLYIPVFCQIQGNLKEYCCHKIDKRITEILEKQRRKRLREQEKRTNLTGGKNGKYSDNGSDSGNISMDTMTAKPTLPVLANDDDLYSDKRPLHDDYYDYPSSEMAYAMSEPATPYRHHAMLASPAVPPMPQRAYTQPTPYSGYNPHHQHYHDEPNDPHSDYFDNASYYSSPKPSHQPTVSSPMPRYNNNLDNTTSSSNSNKYDVTPSTPGVGNGSSASYFPSSGTPRSKPSSSSSPFTPYSDTPTMVASPAPYSPQVGSPFIPQQTPSTPRYQPQHQHTAPSPYSQQHSSIRSPGRQHEYHHQHTF
ncbi:hypothetical protein BCR42DRAFT_412834 [Absidia repens]|uniref:Uncharacterized protein n=1 Tax=Absidia repens TaxID=90262 RepID=A0A1X2IK80_9FUNG|nr:hypothetical protein BCR42DRAFT_412834 [Absidia repens]